MVELLVGLQQKLAEQSTDSIDTFNELFAALQEKTQQTDLDVADLLSQSESSESILHLLGRRASLRDKILGLVKKSMPRARSIKSLLANEMHSLKNGRRALNGYKNVSGNQGKIINSIR